MKNTKWSKTKAAAIIVAIGGLAVGAFMSGNPYVALAVMMVLVLIAHSQRH